MTLPGPLNGLTNPYHTNPKSSNIATPKWLSDYLFTLLDKPEFGTILDPAIGGGSLTRPWRERDAQIIDCDLRPEYAPQADTFFARAFRAGAGANSAA